MKNRFILPALIAGSVALGAFAGPAAQPARADTASTLAIAGAAAIVGALLIDGNNRPYYVQNNRRYYVSQQEATVWRQRHHVVRRQAWVPEREYPVARDPYNNHDRDHR
jgi:hypothetical protein